MTLEQRKETVSRFRAHGFGQEQAVMMAEAIEFALASKEFKQIVGRFGLRHLQDAVESMKFD